MKVSREGIVLIKSFEGFRPRAIRREEGGWVIGYGHTLSAREGASVSEADAELLLRYDLLPVEKTVNHAAPTSLNQHQFDAMVSFAFSVGVDRFQTSDVVGHLTNGAPDQAADALMGWPEPALPQAALRRRAAERALFVADPDTPVAVSDLLLAPVSQAEDVPEAELEAPASDAAGPEEATDRPMAEPEPDQNAIRDPLGAAVSALLGEDQAPQAATVDIVPSVFITAAAVPHAPQISSLPANDAEAETTPSIDPDSLAEPDVVAADDPAPEAVDPVLVDAEDAEPTDTPDPVIEPALTTDPADVTEPAQPSASARTLAVQRFAPYSAPMVGPLPFLQRATDHPAEPDSASLAGAPVETPATDEVPASIQLETEGRRVEDQSVVVQDALPEEDAPLDHQTAASEPTYSAPPIVPAADEHPTEDNPVLDAPIVQPFAAAAEVEPLILSAPDDAPEPALTRQPWTVEERTEPLESNEGGLFGEDLSLTQGGAPMIRHGELELQAPASFDWSETGAFIIMGAVGLTAFGAAMAAFRLASEQAGGGETTIIAWVLAIIGGACVGISSYNLYRRWGLPGGDN